MASSVTGGLFLFLLALVPSTRISIAPKKAPHSLRSGAVYILLFATYLIYSLIAIRSQTT